MELEVIKKVIIDQIQDAKAILNDVYLVEREVVVPSKFLKKPNIIAILGVRRSGKSTLALRIASRHGSYGYVNFDDERLYGIEAEELGLIIDAFIEVLGYEPDLLVLDEIQNVEGWELFVNRMRRTKKVILTGSNANLLEGDLATHLTGRYLDIKVFPFSFTEHLSFKGMKIEEESISGTRSSSKLRSELDDYIVKGGFPEVHIFGRRILSRIYKDILVKDAVLRFGIRNRKAFNEVSRYLISNHSSEFTYSRLARKCGISNKNMVSEYVGDLEEVELVFHLERYSPKLSEQSNSPKKIYCIDTGLIGAVGFNVSSNKGPLMENIVAVELLRRISGVEKQLYYWKDHSMFEVDFVLREGKRIVELIQVCLSIDEQSTRNREIRALVKASSKLECRDLKIITWNDEGTLEIDDINIKIVPLYKWLFQRDPSAPKKH